MHIYSYVIPHDTGFAPNPHGGFLTLATCKPKIRAKATVGDYLVGTGSARTVGMGKLVYAAIISEVLSIEDYGSSPKYSIKHPSMSGAEWHKYGDNIYFYKDDQWHQRRNRYHGRAHMRTDLSGQNVLVCEQFWYFGDSAIEIPPDFQKIVKAGPGHKKVTDFSVAQPFIEWLVTLPSGNQSDRRIQITDKNCSKPIC